MDNVRLVDFDIHPIPTAFPHAMNPGSEGTTGHFEFRAPRNARVVRSEVSVVAAHPPELGVVGRIPTIDDLTVDFRYRGQPLGHHLGYADDVQRAPDAFVELSALRREWPSTARMQKGEELAFAFRWRAEAYRYCQPARVVIRFELDLASE